MDKLKELLGEELYNQVVSKLGDAKADIVSDGRWFPKDKFDQLNEAKKQLDTDLKDRDKQLADLKKAAGDNEELKKQIETLQETNKTTKETYEGKLKEMSFTSAIKAAIAGEAHDPDIVSGLLDRTKLILSDDGKVSGLDEQLKGLKEAKPFLFTEKQPGQPQFSGAKPVDAGGGKPGSLQTLIENQILGGMN
ncbi:phage scaffolding protein [Paenibacillus gansuensis]|uniref:Phage scaffolding protein n=1 Tax=Paenibacillus gansuensis TaxID=306542 RepID=A0ABW5PEV4_9BACL